MAIQKHEYELSIWSERLTDNGVEEHKQQIIGAHDMSHLGRATKVHFRKLLNGTHVLTFEMPTKFFNSELGQYVQNELLENIFNEQKIKLHFQDKWYEMVVKNVTENKNFKSIMKSITCSDGYIDELSRIGYDIQLDPELNNSVNEINDFMDVILDNSSTWQYKPEFNWGDFTEYREERFYRIPLSCFKNNTIKAHKLNLSANFNKKIINYFTKEKRPLEMGDDLAGKEDIYWNQYSTGESFINPLYVGEESLITGEDDYIYVPMSDFSIISPYLYKNLESAAQSTLSYYEESHKHYAIQPVSNNPKDIIQFIYLGNINNQVFHIDEANVLTDYSYTYILTIENWEKQNCIADNNVKVYYQNDKQQNVFLNRNVNSLNSFMWKPVYYDGYLDSIGQLEVSKARRVNIANRTELNLYDDTFVTVYNNKVSNTELKKLLSLSTEEQNDYNNYRIVSKTDTRQVLPTLARNLISNGTKITNTTGWGTRIQKVNISSEGNVARSLSELKIQTFDIKLNGTSESPHYYLYYHQKIKDDYLINFGFIGNDKKIKKNKVYALRIVTVTISKNNDKEIYQENINKKDIIKKIIIGKGSIDSDGNYKITNPISFNTFNLQDNTDYILFKINQDIENPYICFNLEVNESIKISDFELFEAFTRGKDISDYDNCKRPEEDISNMIYNYSGREITFTNENEFLNNNNIEFNSINKRDLLLESDVTIGNTYEIQNYFIQYKENLKEEDSKKDTFNDKEKWYEDNDSNYSNEKYVDEDFKYENLYFNLDKCNYLNEQSTPECSCGENTLNICYYKKFGFCPYLFSPELHPRRIRTLQQSKSNRFNLIQELSKVFEVYPTFSIIHDERGRVVLDKESNPQKYIHFITEKGNEQLTGFRYEKNLSNISRTIESQSITTKLFVDPIDSEYYDTGYCTIQTANDNIGKNSYILDFSYYTKNGLLNSIDVEKDLYGLEDGDIAFLSIMDSLNGKYDMLQRRISALTNESYKTLKATNITNINGVLASLEEKQKTLQKMNRYNKDNKDNETYQKYEIECKELTATFYGLIKDLFFTDNKCYNPYLNDGTLETEKTEEWFWQNIVCNNGQIWEDFVEDIINKNKYKQCGTIGQQTKIEEEVNDLRKKCNKVLKNIVSKTKEFEVRYEKYLKEGTWTDSNYLTDNEYYWGGVSVLDSSSKPQVNYNINVIDLFKADIPNNDLYEIDLGDITYIEDIDFFGINNITGLPNKEKVLVSEIDFSLDQPQENSIKIQNYTTQFEDLFQQITASVQSLTYNENVYKRAQSFTAKHYVQSDSLQGTLDQGALTLLNANDSLKLDDNGTEGNALQNSASRYKLNGDGLFFSTDGGQSWINAVSPKGYNMNYAKIGALDTGKIRIVDSDYVYFLWDQNGISAYRTPSNNELKNDFARFNKYGLSLVQNNKIRLRSGYEYKYKEIEGESEIDKKANQGKITREDEITNNNIGFYLYDQKGQVIFKTEVDGEGSDEDKLSARMSITGEMFAQGLLSEEIKTIHTYEGLHELSYPSTYYERASEEITDQSIISHLTHLEDERLYVIYYQDNIEKALNTKFYYYDNHMYIKQDNKYYEISNIINDGIYFEIGYSPYDSAGGKEIEPSEYTYFSFNENYEGTLHKNESFYLYDINKNGNIYMCYEQRSDSSKQISDQASVYINNKDILDSSNLNTNSNSNNEYNRRLMCISKTSNSLTKNLFSVLDNGTLYIGGDIIGENNNQDFEYNHMPDKIKVINAGIELTDKGITMNGKNLDEEIQRRLDEITQIVANAGVPAHSHQFSIPKQSLVNNIENGTVESNKHIYLYPNHPASQEEVSGNQNSEELNLKNIYIALSNEPYYKPDQAPSSAYWSKISWVKLSDFLSSLNLQSKDWTADTQSTGVNGGGGGSVNPTPYSGSLIVSVAKQVVNAHYNYMMENGLYGSYYSNYLYITPTVNSNALKSRRDCSGLINGIWQALGDMTVQNSYGLTTYAYRTNHPRNWDLIKITTNYSVNNLQPGDVLFREGATKGFPDGHTELVTEILSNGQVKTYSLGSDSGLVQSFNNNNYTYAISNYDYILRRNNNSQDMPQNSDMILIDRSIYDSTTGNDNQSAVNFYFSGQLPNTYIGPYPSSREVYESNACAGLRCIVDLCLHEYGSWRFAAASYAKLVRAYLIGGTYATSFDYNAGRRSTNLYEWMWNITHNTQSIFGDWSINNGNNHNHQTISMDFVQAIYKNLKYPDLYGASLHTGSNTFKNAICRAANGIPTSNGGYWTYVSQARFIVDYGSDSDYATTPVNRNSYYGRYLMYRMPNDFTIFNTYIVS